MTFRVFLLSIATGLLAYGLLASALETIWAVCAAAWLSSAVAFVGIVIAERRDAS